MGLLELPVFTLDPLLFGAGAGTALLIAFAWRRSPAGPSVWRVMAAVAATVLWIGAWISPLQELSIHYLLAAHMLQFTVVSGMVAPLLLVAIPPDVSFRLPPRLQSLAGLASHPIVGLIAVISVFFIWHTAAVYDTSVKITPLYDLGQICSLLAAMLFWWPIINPLQRIERHSAWAKLTYILLVTIPQTIAGITIALAQHPLYDAYVNSPRITPLSLMQDQQMAGICLALLTKVALLVACAVLFASLLTDVIDDSDDGGYGTRRHHDAPPIGPSGSVVWLDRLNSGDTVPEPIPPRWRRRPVARR